MEHYGEQYLVSSAGALQPTEMLRVHAVLEAGNVFEPGMVVSVRKDNYLLVERDPRSFGPAILLAPGSHIELRDAKGELVPCKWAISKVRPLQQQQQQHVKPNPVQATGTWRYTEDGTLHAEEVLRVDRVFVESKVTGVLRVEVDRRFVVAEGPAELFHKTVDLPAAVLTPGQVIEMVGANRERVPCTWFVVTAERSAFATAMNLTPEPTKHGKSVWHTPYIKRSDLAEAEPTKHVEFDMVALEQSALAKAKQAFAKGQTTPKLILRTDVPKQPEPKRSHIAKRMGAIDIPSGKCGKCDSCELERIGCGCDGALDDGCFLCHPEKHERPPCPGS